MPTHATTKGHDVSYHENLESVQRMGQTAGAQLARVVAKVLVTLFVSGMVTMVTGYVKDMRDDLRTACAKIEAQQTAQALLSQRVEGVSKITDATVAALNAISQQVQHNTYDVQALKAERDSAERRR